MPHPERQCSEALPLFCPSPDGSLSPPLCPFLPSCRLPSPPSFSLSPPLCPPSPHPFSHSPPLCPSSPPFLLAVSAALLSISVGMGMASAAPEGVLARLETMSVGFWLTTFYVPVNSISLNWFGGVAVNHLLCKCHHLHRVSRYRCRDGDGLGWLVTYDTRPRAY